MTNEEKIAIIFHDTSSNVKYDNLIAYLNELIQRADKEPPAPQRSKEKGFEDYWVVYDTFSMPSNGAYANVMTHIETESKVIVLHDYFDHLPKNVRHLILHHEVCHILNDTIFTDEKQIEQYKMERKEYMDKNEAHPNEIACDKYAISKMDIENAVNAFDYLISKSKDPQELIIRKRTLFSQKEGERE